MKLNIGSTILQDRPKMYWLLSLLPLTAGVRVTGHGSNLTVCNASPPGFGCYFAARP